MKTSAIILAYKESFETIKATIKAVKKCGVDEIILIDNGLKCYSKIKGVEIFTTDKNLGSAGGFKFGMQKATQEFFWLLDADNVPQSDSLDLLRENYDGGAVCSYRARYGAIANLNSYDLKPIIGWNAVLGFSFLRFWTKNKIFGKKEPMKLKVSKIPVSCYGGMFFHHSLPYIIGYPDKKYKTYCDDYEWSRRIVEMGMNLLLVRDSIIKDSN